jgi:flagellar biosynthesis/type III secretory pathway protein FliH
MRWSNRPSAPPPERLSTPPAVAEISFVAAPRIEIPESEPEPTFSVAPRISSPPPKREDSPELVALVADLKAIVRSAAEQVVETRRRALQESERELVRLAFAIATRVVSREVDVDPTLVTAWAREGIDALGAHDRVTIALSPEVVEALEARGERPGLEELGEVVADPRLGRAECEVRGKFGRIDESVKARLDAVAAALELDQEEELP